MIEMETDSFSDPLGGSFSSGARGISHPSRRLDQTVSFHSFSGMVPGVRELFPDELGPGKSDTRGSRRRPTNKGSDRPGWFVRTGLSGDFLQCNPESAIPSHGAAPFAREFMESGTVLESRTFPSRGGPLSQAVKGNNFPLCIDGDD